MQPITIDPLSAIAKGHQLRDRRERRDLIKMHGPGIANGDPAALEALAKVDPIQAAGIKDAIAKRQAAQAGAARKEEEEARKRQLAAMGMAAAAVRGARDPEDYAQREAFLIQNGIITPEQSQGMTFENRGALIDMITGLEGQMEDERDRRDYFEGQRQFNMKFAEGQRPDFGLADKLSDNFRSEPAVKIFSDVQDAASRVAEFYANPGSVSDYGLAVSFAKLVDPGSVAREGEVAAVQKSGALSASMKQALLNAITGEGALPEGMRAEIASLAQGFYDRQAAKYGGVYDDYAARATRLGVPTDLALPSPVSPFSVRPEAVKPISELSDAELDRLIQEMSQ